MSAQMGIWSIMGSIVVILLVLPTLIHATSGNETKSCGVKDGKPAFYNDFIDDFEVCPTNNVNQSCSNADDKTAEENCLKCCPRHIEETHKSMTTGMIIGVVVGGIVLIAVAAIVVVCIIKHRSNEERQTDQTHTNSVDVSENNKPILKEQGGSNEETGLIATKVDNV